MKVSMLSLLLALSSVAPAQTAANSATVAGVVYPSSDAFGRATTVHVNRYKDAECVKHSDGEFSLGRVKTEAPSCSSEVKTVTVDRSGHYELLIEPGWYSVHILWATQSAPSHPRVCKFAEWTIGYFPWRDETHTFDMIAQQSRAFQVNEAERKQVDFTYQNELSNPSKFTPIDCVELRRNGWVRSGKNNKNMPSFDFVPPPSPPAIASKPK